MLNKKKKKKNNPLKNLIVSKIKLHGDNQSDLAEYIGISPQRLNAKLNRTNGADFTRSEIAKINKRYNLTDEELVKFFTENVPDLGTK